MIVSATASVLTFPSLCSCCAGTCTTTYDIAHSIHEGRKTTTHTWRVPYCMLCTRHEKATRAGVIEVILTLLTLGLFLIPYVIFIKPIRYRKARALMTASCSRPDAPTLKYDRGVSHFDVGSPQFVEALRRLNPGAISG
jgi:hypothetical protein